MPCPRHPKSAKMRAYNQKRRQEYGTDLGYGPAWRRLRAEYLKRHPYCVVCGQPATDVDHIKPRPRGAALDTSTHDHESNLQALCGRDHKAKTMRETNARRR